MPAKDAKWLHHDMLSSVHVSLSERSKFRYAGHFIGLLDNKAIVLGVSSSGYRVSCLLTQRNVAFCSVVRDRCS
jgi:hypothetical protein